MLRRGVEYYYPGKGASARSARNYGTGGYSGYGGYSSD
jgi:hypothetical protein